jgi:serine/threonine-protein kinase
MNSTDQARSPAGAASFLERQALLHTDRPGGSDQEDGDTRTILHRRLGVLFPVGGAIWGSLLLLSLTGIDPAMSRANVGWVAQALLALATVVSGICAAVLRGRPGLGLGWLRGLELLVFGVYAAVAAALRVALFRRGLFGEFADAKTAHFFLCWSAAYNGFGWLSLIMFYGVSIPNTWRRALAVVLALVLVPLAIDATFLLSAPTWSGTDSVPYRLAYPLLMTGQMLLVGVAIALFGSYKLGALQEEARQARREARAARALGPYVLKQRLGAGGMGEVYLAEHRLLKRPCAVKLIRHERAGDPAVLARFDREVRATARLKHPNTVEVFDYGRHADGTFYYVMEYLDGLGLDEVVSRSGPLPPARVVRILRQLCGALHEAHSLGLIHRDVKPSNVLLCRHGGFHDVVKLVDFGLVQTAVGAVAIAAEGGPLTQAGSLLGTPDYMSPEQADGTALLDARSDLYGVGATAYFLLTGRPPFAGRTMLDVLFAHRHEPVPSLADQTGVPAALEAVIRRCLAKQPSERYASAEELDRDLDACGVEEWTEAEARAWWATAAAPSTADKTG